MSDVEYLFIGFVIYAFLDVVVFCKQNNRISNLEWKLREIEKKQPQKPKERKAGFKSFDYVCPVCGRRLISKVDGEWVAGSKSKFCKICGEELDWSDTE